MLSLDFRQVASNEELMGYIDNGLYDLYDACFGVAPYFEDIEIDRLRSIFMGYLDNGFVYLCFNEDKIVGFMAAIPLPSQGDVYNIAKEHIVNADEYWYHADIGAAPQLRGKGIAKGLMQILLDKTPASSILMRTYENNEDSKGLHKRFGFNLLTHPDGTPVTQNVEGKRKSGHVEIDKRIFMTLVRE